MAARESGQGYWMEDDVTGTLRAEGENRPSRPSNVVMATGQAGAEITEGHAPIAFSEGYFRCGGGHSPRGDGAVNTLQCNTGDQRISVAFAENSRAELRYCGGDGKVSSQLTTGGGKPGQGSPCVAIQDGRGLEKKQNGIGLNADGSSYTIDAVGGQAVAFSERADCLTSAYGTKWNGNASADNGSLFVKNSMAVRRLTPTECERLQGFPDSFTRIPWRNKPADQCPDGPRYKALGNSMAVNCMEWIGRRIEHVEKL